MIQSINTIPDFPVNKKSLARKRLNTLLSSGINKSLISITAGAGCGKTQAVSSCLDGIDAHIVWIQLSKLDNLPSRFWESLIRALSFKNPDIAAQMRMLGFPDSTATLHNFLYQTIKRLRLDKPCIIILDDFHLIDNKQILWLVENTINAQLENICTILVSRTHPQLNIHPNILNSKTLFINPEHLLFTPKETEDYFRQLQLQLSPSQTKQVYELSEGWPFSLHLIGISLAEKTTIELSSMDRSFKIIFQLIEHEIFSKYRPEIQKFLVRLSLLDNYDMELVHTLAGEIETQLPALVDANMFLSFNPYSSSYHLHNLFVQFLQMQNLLTEEEKRKTYLTLARWHQEKNRLTDAIIYFYRAENYDTCWDLIYILGLQRYCPKSTADFLLDYIERISRHTGPASPKPLLAKANLLINNNRLEEADKLLNHIASALGSKPERTAEETELLGETYIIKGILSFCLRRLDLAENFRRACDYLPDGNHRYDHSLRMMDSNHAAIMRTPEKGELKKMQDVFFEAIPYTSRLVGKGAYGRAYLCRAEGSYLTGDMADALHYASQIVTRSEQNKNILTAGMGYYIMMRIAAAEGNYRKVMDCLDKLNTLGDPVAGTTDYPLIIDVAKGWLFCKLKIFDQIPDWILDESLHSEIIPPISIGRDRILRAECMLYQKQYYDLLAFLKHSGESFRISKNWVGLLYSKILLSIASCYLGRQEDTLHYFTEAYDLAKGNNLVMPFIELGSYTRTLVNSIESLESCIIPGEWLAMIKKKANTYAKRTTGLIARHNKEKGPNTFREYDLTSREMDILQDLCQGLTREEIAAEYGISINTVKSKLQTIYSKLGALNVADAVRIAISSKLVG